MKYLSPREVRQQIGMNQTEFWARVGVTQSGGSRYENGFPMPKAVRELVRVVHIEKIRIELANHEDLEIISLLKERYTDLYRVLIKRFATNPVPIGIERRYSERRARHVRTSPGYDNRRYTLDRLQLSMAGL